MYFLSSFVQLLHLLTNSTFTIRTHVPSHTLTYSTHTLHTLTQSESLQDDIFTTCFAPKPAHSADEWLGGADKDPLLLKYTRDELVDVPPAECQKVSAVNNRYKYSNLCFRKFAVGF